MASFNKGKIRGLSGVGAGLLNEESRKAFPIQRKTEFISYNRIHPNPRNEMSMSGIDALANQIKYSGLEQPLVVYQQEDGDYKILTGHRRYAAIGMLIERGDWDADSQLIECKVKDLEEMDIPLETADKEMLSILVTNQTREKTDGDIAFEIKEWKKIILKLREKGISFMVSGYGEDGEPIKRNIEGVRTQELIAEQMGISNAQVGKYNKIENQGSDALKEALKQNKINVSNAANVAGMEHKEQDELIKKVLKGKGEGGQITSEDLALAKKEKDDSKNKKKSAEDVPSGFINDKIFKQDIKNIQKSIKSSVDGIQLSENQYSDYCRYINGLKKLFNV